MPYIKIFCSYLYYQIVIKNKNRKMLNNPPLILTPDDVNHPNKKYKFWNTAIAGNQKSPTNMSLVQTTETLSQHNNQVENIIVKSGSVGKQTFDSLGNGENRNIEEIHDRDSDFNTEEEDGSDRNTFQQRIETLEEQIEDYRKKFEQGRILNTNLVKELNKTTNQLRAAETLNEQLNAECDKLYTSVKNAHDRHSQVQNQKMELLTQISMLNQQKQLALSKNQINEEQVNYLMRKMQTLHEEISFQKSISNDLRKEILMLKQQLNKMMNTMQNYSDLQQDVVRTRNINQQIQKGVVRLEEELKKNRLKVKQSEISEQKFKEQQNKLFIKIQQLEAESSVLKEKIRMTDEEIRARNKQLSILGDPIQYEVRYAKIIQQYEKRNEDLVFQLMALSERNHKLLDQRDYYLRRVEATISNKYERLPYDQFVSILKQANADINNLRRMLELKEDQMQQMKSKYEQQIGSLKGKINELNNIIKIREKQTFNKQQILENQVRIYKKQLDLLGKRNEELKSSQVKLRIQVMQKDKIIMDFIEKRKAEEQSKKQMKSVEQSTTSL